MGDDAREVIELEPGPGEPPPVPTGKAEPAPLSMFDLPARASPPRTVGDLMTRKVVTLGEHEPIGDLEGLMKRFGFRHVPVVAADTTLVGLITRVDLLHAMLGRTSDGKPVGRVGPDTPASAVMNREIVTADFDTPLVAALSVMLDEKLGCLPVVRYDTRLVGIVTETDFARLQLESLKQQV
jgi:CBS domain-containing protein